MLRRAILAVAALLVTAPMALAEPAAGTTAEARPDAYILPGDAVYPEGIAIDRAAQTFYVGSTNGGAIYRGHLDNPLTEIWLPAGGDGRTAITGMKVSGGRLYAAGAASGFVFVYDIATKALVAKLAVPTLPTFLNDIAIAGGAAYVTDSVNPVLYRVADDAGGTPQIEPWLDFTGTELQYQTGFNVNGIAPSQHGKYLVLVQSNTGKLFRVEIATKEVREIDLGGATVPAGDGLLLQGRDLYVVQNAIGQITKIRLKGGLLSGRIVDSLSDPRFITPTTMAATKARFLVVIAQFSRRATGNPDLPFTVASVPHF